MADNQYIQVSGLPTYEEIKEQTVFPSGVFGVAVEAYLSAVSATFGFGTSPHRFELEYIPASFSFNTLPTIGLNVSFYIGDFYIAGRIKHADYSKSNSGKVLSIQIEDVREDLGDYYIDTYGIFGSSDAPTTNVVDVRYWYIKTYVETRTYGRSRIVRDLDLLDNQGASYRQIYEAIKYFENTVGNVSNLVSKIPDPEVIEAQLPGDADAYRWKFRSEPMIQVLNKIFDDISYDWYWNMSESCVNVINKKYAIDIDENNIPVAGDTNPTRSVRYGKDEGERATVVRILGAEMEGLVGSGSLQYQSGAYEISPSTYDMGIQVGTLTFVPGWSATLKYYGPDGWLNSYIPTDKELAMALKGMEFWCMEKGIENRLEDQTYDATTGTTITQQSWSASGIGTIENRRLASNIWVIEWYNRVRTHAQNHYGRTYVLSPSSLLHDYLDEIEVISAAWCNIENLTDDGAFNDNYKIREKYKWLAIFWEHDANKMHGWARFSSTNTKWGFDGEGTPGSEYNDDETTTYVPIEVKKWDKAQRKFDEEYLEVLTDQEQGILIRLPNLAWDNSRSYEYEGELNQVSILKHLFTASQRDTTIDIADPYKLPLPFTRLQDVTIPIRVKRRYGYSYPEPWASGTGTSREVVVKDDFAPWNYEPRGTKTSVQLMNDEAKAALAGRVVTRNQVTFAEVQKLNLPVISFDGFANQAQTSQGFGIVSHGVTSLNITKNTDWFQTKYSIKSHFPEFIKAKPIYTGLGEDFDFMLKRNHEDDIRIPDIPDFEVPDYFNPITPDNRSFKVDSGIEQKLERYVTIQMVYNRGANEYYLSVDSNNIQWPRSLAMAFGSSADREVHCIDGFLQVGMKAVYHMEVLTDGSVLQYYTGGVALEAGRVVELVTAPALINQIYYSTVRTLPTVVTAPDGTTQTVTPFYYYNVPWLGQTSVDTSLIAGDKAMLASHGNKKSLVPDGNYIAGGDRDGDAYLVNSGGSAASTMLGYVTTAPNGSTGRNGVIKTYSSTGGVYYTDGVAVGGKTYNIYFVGCEASQVQVNDPCIITQERETGGAYRLYCFIVKPTFAAGGSFV